MQGIVGSASFGQSYSYDAGPYDANEAVDMFYEPLSRYGLWLAHEEYGLVWRPNNFYIHSDWRSYTVGYWVYTDYGWTWVSDEPWGWASYHYGRWFYDDRFGWLWHPDTVWGPAWVVWRYGGSRIGWAPMPPKIIWKADLGLDFTYIDVDELIPYEHFCFVKVVDFVRVDIIKVIVFPKNRHDFILRDTKIALDYKKRGDKIVNSLPIQEHVEQAAQEPIKQVKVVETSSLDEQGLRGGEVRVFRPIERRGEAIVPQAQAPVRIEYRGPSRPIQQPQVIRQPQAPINIERRGPRPQAPVIIERRGSGPIAQPQAQASVNIEGRGPVTIIERIERRGSDRGQEVTQQEVIQQERKIEEAETVRQGSLRGAPKGRRSNDKVGEERRDSQGRGRRGGSAKDEDEIEGRRGRRGPSEFDFRNQGVPPPRLR